MHLKIAVVLIVLVCLTFLGEAQRREKRSSSSSSSSSSSNHPKHKSRPRSCVRRSFGRLKRCEKCCSEYCHSCQRNSHNNRYKCKLVHCDIVPAPSNGMVTAIDHHKCGSSLLYTCFPGYQLSGPETRICKSDGNWGGKCPECLAICPHLCSPWHGNINMTLGNLAGSKVTYSCDHDYSLIGPEERTCMDDGTWDYDDPHCEPVAKCPIPSDISNGEIDYSGLYEDDYVNYHCDYDYERIGPEVRTCKGGSWTEEEPRCGPVVKCPFPCAPNNGYLDFDMNSTRPGDMVWYFCDDDFMLSGTGNRTCEADGTWSEPEPACIPEVRCPYLCDPHNGFVLYDHNRRVGTVATFDCFPEYELSDTNEIICGASGDWSNPSPVCTPVVRCPSLCNPSNGHVNQSDNLVGSMAMYECDPEFVLSGSESSVCQSDGTWSELEPVCEPVVRCTPLCDPSSGYVNHSDNLVGSMAMYECDQEFVLSGPVYRLCQSDGTWSDIEPVCDPVVRCPDLCDPNNGQVDHYDTLVGSDAMYSCDKDYVLKGVENRVCLSDGTWNNSEPVCEPEVTCPSIDPISNGGSITPSGSKVGATVYFFCNSRFKLHGTEYKHCAENGSWVPMQPLPTCHPINNCGNRWYLAYEHDKHSNRIHGYMENMYDAVVKGAEFRVRFPALDIVTRLRKVRIYYGLVCGQIIFQMKKNGYDRFQDPAVWKFQTVCTRGTFHNLEYNYGEYVSPGNSFNKVHTQWFMRERCYNKPLLTSVYNGKIQSGSVSAVIDAVKQGQSIQMISGRASLSVDHIEYNNIEDEFVIMDLWWIYATYSWNSLVDFLKFYLYPASWQFSLYSSTLKVHASYWQIGDNSKVWDIPGHAWGAEWLTDPCWNIVYKNDENGTALTGYDIADLRDKALNGHKIRVTYNRQQMECSEVLLKDDHVCCACFNKFSKSGIDTFPSDVNHSPEIICSNGNINRLEIAVGSNEVVNGTMEENAAVAWSVDVRQWKKVASISASGHVTHGSKHTLKYAMENGAEVRYKVKFDLDSPYWAIVEPDQVEVNGDELAAMVIRSISMQPDDDFVFKYTQERPCLRPSVMATTGRMDILKLTLGEHETRDHYSMQYESDWFVNL